MRKIICKRCGKSFSPTTWNQIYCGSKTKKTGCSYREHILRIGRYNKEKNSEYMSEYAKKWSTNNREKCREACKKSYHKNKIKNREHDKIRKSIWRKFNIKKILEWNRRRMLKKKGVIGNHTNNQWEVLKKKFKYKCAACRISEKELTKRWKGTYFAQLTRDHIIPISKDGTDYIENIQPLCISCNTIKKDKLYGK